MFPLPSQQGYKAKATAGVALGWTQPLLQARVSWTEGGEGMPQPVHLELNLPTYKNYLLGDPECKQGNGVTLLPQISLGIRGQPASVPSTVWAG